MPHNSRPLAYAVGAMALVFSWQWATVHANYGGNWSALYCTGARLGVPPRLAAEHIYEFPGSFGFDGQMYHYVAHDPLIRTPDLKAAVDAPWLRYRRILVPGLAYVLALGRANWVDPAYFALVLIFIGAGVYWSVECSQALGRSPAWGLLFLLMPATLISMDRLVLDVALAALSVAFAYYVREPGWRLFAVLAAAALARETGFVLLAAYCGYLLLARRFKLMAQFALAGVPAVAWYGYVQAHTGRQDYQVSLLPFSAIWQNWLHPLVYPAGMQYKWVAMLGDRMAMIGMLLAFALAAWWGVRPKPSPVAVGALAFAAMGVILQKTEIWANVYDYGRVYTPCLLFLGILGPPRKAWAALAPLAFILPRIGMQLTPQILGVLRAIKL